MGRRSGDEGGEGVGFMFHRKGWGQPPAKAFARLRTGRMRAAIAMTCAIGLLVPVAAEADDGGDSHGRDFDARPLTSRWFVQAGGSLTAYQTSAAWSPAGLAGAVIVLEDALGLDEENQTWFIRACYRFNGRHAIEFLATDLKRTATRTIDGEIEWGDYVVRAEGRVSTSLTTNIYKLKWKYDFSDSGRLNAGFTAGLSTFELGLRLEGEARLEGAPGNEWIEGVVEGADGIAPVPVIGFYLEYAMSPRWILRASTEAMDLSLGSQSGRVLQSNLEIGYGFTDLFSVGLNLGGLDLEYRGDEGDEKFGVDYRVTAIGAHVGFAF